MHGGIALMFIYIMLSREYHDNVLPSFGIQSENVSLWHSPPTLMPIGSFIYVHILLQHGFYHRIHIVAALSGNSKLNMPFIPHIKYLFNVDKSNFMLLIYKFGYLPMTQIERFMSMFVDFYH
jgi:hypothetical protein